MSRYKYKPTKFYLLTFAFTWLICATHCCGSNGFVSKSKLLKDDYKQKLIGFY